MIMQTQKHFQAGTLCVNALWCADYCSVPNPRLSHLLYHKLLLHLDSGFMTSLIHILEWNQT